MSSDEHAINEGTAVHVIKSAKGPGYDGTVITSKHRSKKYLVKADADGDTEWVDGVNLVEADKRDWSFDVVYPRDPWAGLEEKSGSKDGPEDDEETTDPANIPIQDEKTEAPKSGKASKKK
jgi:hypothetical protein